MKKSEYEKFQMFKKQHHFTDSQIIKIMTDYANTTDEYATSFFVAKYHITEREFYKMRDFCIIFMLVEAPVCRRIRDKASRNQSKKNNSGNCTSSNQHYSFLIQKRKEYLKSFSDEEINAIAVEYSKGDAIYDIAKKHNISPYTVRKLIAIALVKHLITNEIYHLVKYRSQCYLAQLSYFNGFTAEQIWNGYLHWD